MNLVITKDFFFNPCCSGIRSVRINYVIRLREVFLFQSLLFWNSVCERAVLIGIILRFGFQSLLFWNSVCELNMAELAGKDL